MGGAVASDVTDFSANYYNPSGLVLAERTTLSVGVQSVSPSLQLDGQDSPATPFRSLVLGLSAPGEMAGTKVAFGVGLNLTGDRLSRIVTFAEDDQRWVLHQDRPEQIFIAANAAVQPFEFMSVGFGLAFLASTDGVLRLSGSATQPGFAGENEYDSRLDHEVLAELESQRYPLLGLTLLPDEVLTFSLVYRGETQVVLDVDAEFDGEIALGPLEFPAYYLLESTTVQSFVPRQLVVSTSYSGVDALHLNLEVQWSQWSRYRSPLSATQSQLEVDSMGVLLVLPELPEPTQLVSARLADRITPRLGCEYSLRLRGDWSLPLRAGYVFEASPLTATSSSNFVDADRHVVSLGFGLEAPGPSPLTGRVLLDAHGAYSGFVPRNVPGPDGETHRAGGSIWVFGATLGLEL